MNFVFVCFFVSVEVTCAHSYASKVSRNSGEGGDYSDEERGDKPWMKAQHFWPFLAREKTVMVFNIVYTRGRKSSRKIVMRNLQCVQMLFHATSLLRILYNNLDGKLLLTEHTEGTDALAAAE